MRDARAHYDAVEQRMLASRESGNHTELDEDAFMDELDYWWHRLSAEDRAWFRKRSAERRELMRQRCDAAGWPLRDAP